MEQRLIDANALKNDINAQVAILNSLSVSTGIDELRQIGEELQRGMVAEIDKQPTVDAVPVVRCMKCRHAKPYSSDGAVFWCGKNNLIKYGVFYCADGERKDNE